MDVIEQAMALIQREPIPADAFEQMKALELQADKFEITLFPDLYEALAVKAASFDHPEPGPGY